MLERFVLTVLAGLLVGLVLNNPWHLDRIQKSALFVIIVGTAVFAARTVENIRNATLSETRPAVSSGVGGPAPADGQGGRGGGGNAVGKNSMVLGGHGGPGGGPGGGRGGPGGGGDATGEGSLVVGGDGGGGGGPDGRGGRGAASPLTRVPPEVLKRFGLTGSETYGQGGDGANTPEYDRRLRVLNILSAEYRSRNPTAPLMPMPGLLMPPVDWVNSWLSQARENFHVELAEKGSDFFLRTNSDK